MRSDIHPTYYPQATITCACGRELVVGSTAQATHVELCSACHPFYTGTQKIVDSARRVDRFQQRTAKRATKAVASKREKKARDTARRKARADALGAEK